MAKIFLKLGLNGKVINSVDVMEDAITDANGVVSEELGINFLSNITGWSIWKMADGGREDVFDDEKNIVIPKKPYPSWTYNEENNSWVAPVANDNEWTPDNPTGHDKWDEENQTWYS